MMQERGRLVKGYAFGGTRCRTEGLALLGAQSVHCHRQEGRLAVRRGEV